MTDYDLNKFGAMLERARASRPANELSEAEVEERRRAASGLQAHFEERQEEYLTSLREPQ